MELTKKFSEFKYWFTPTCDGDYTIWHKQAECSVGTIQHIDASEPGYDEIQLEFGMYKNRPEWVVGQPLTQQSIDNGTPEDAKKLYQSLMVGVAAIRAFHHGADPDMAFGKIKKTLDWLDKTDFYVAPASTIYHESEPHGLLHHTLRVVEEIIQLARLPKFCDCVRIQDAVLVALVHDWCKIGLYEMYMRNQKNDETGQWEKVPAYKRKDCLLPMGHGATSMWQASKCFNLSNQEALAIRWHQGRWNVCEAEVNEFQQANENYPLVHMLQFADQLAITKY